MPAPFAETQRDHGPLPRRVMFTDIVNVDRDVVTASSDDAGRRCSRSLARSRAHCSRKRLVVKNYLAAGRIKLHTGDGIMASFISAAAAVRSACQVQGALRDHNVSGPDPPVIRPDWLCYGLLAMPDGETRAKDVVWKSPSSLPLRSAPTAEPGQITHHPAVDRRPVLLRQGPGGSVRRRKHAIAGLKVLAFAPAGLKPTSSILVC